MVDYKCTCRVQKKLIHENCTWHTVLCLIYTRGLQFPLFSSVHNAPVLCIVTNTILNIDLKPHMKYEYDVIIVHVHLKTIQLHTTVQYCLVKLIRGM